MSSGRKQVEAGHYFQRGYDTPKRFASYWHQIDLSLSRSPKTVLEIGPGNGFLSSYLRRAGLEVTTVDLDPELAPSVAAALPELPFADGSFDLVVCFEVLEHLPFERFVPCLREIRRVSRENIAISIPDAERVLKFDTTLSKLWHIHFLFDVPRIFAPKHTFNGEHHWEIGKRGTRKRDVLDAMREAGLAVRRHWRAFETPYHHFFDLSKS